MDYFINLFIGVVSGLAASFFVLYIYDQETRPLVDINTEENPAVSPDGTACFNHLIVSQKKPAYLTWACRKPAWSCKATYDVYDSDRKRKIIESVQCRWPSAPEPLNALPDGRGGVQLIPDFSRLFLGRKADIFYNEDQALDLVLKRNGEEDCYIFTNECYLDGGFNYHGEKYKLSKGSYWILASVFYETETLRRWFRLENNGTNKESVKVYRESEEVRESEIMKSQGQKDASITASLFYTILAFIGVGFLPIVLKIENWPPSWIMALVVAIIVFLTTQRPKFGNLNPATLIALGALLFVGLGTLWQKEDFESRNRPYIQILNSPFKIKITGNYRWSNKESPEPEFLLSWGLVNHGSMPAHFEEIVIKGHANEDKLKTAEAIRIGPDDSDRARQWVSQDVFPFHMSSDAHLREVNFFLNTEDVKKLFSLELDGKEIIKNNKQLEGGQYSSPYLSSMADNKFKDFYLIIKLKYHALADIKKEKNPYQYWEVFRYKEGNYYPIDSGISTMTERPKIPQEISESGQPVKRDVPATGSAVSADAVAVANTQS